MHEMPLLVFTLIEQTAIGALIALAVMRLAGKLSDEGVGFKISLIVFILSLVGMGASMLHLGQPTRAVNVLFGLGSSWLSREILFFGLFAAAAIVAAIGERMGNAGLAKACYAIGAVAGVLALVSTSLCYMQPGVPAWDSVATPAQFALTTVACGIPFYGALSASFSGKPGAKAGVWWAVFAVLLISQIAMRYFFFADIVTLTSVLPTT